MNKRRFGLTVLLSLLATVIILYAVIANAMKNKDNGGDKAPTNGGIYIDRQPSEVAKITYRTGSEEFTVRKDESIYVLHEDTEFPLDPTALAFITNAATRITYERRINPEGNDLAEYGLTDPQTVIDIVYDDGAKLTLKIGNYNAYSEAYYCTTGDGFVYLMGGEFSEAFAYTFHDIIFHDFVETPQNGFSSVTKVEIVGNGSRTFYELVDSENDAWQKNGESGEYAYEIMNIYNELYRLSVSEWVAYNIDTEEEYGVYGLNPPDVRVVFTHIETEEIEVDGGSTVTKEHEKQTAFLIGPSIEEDAENHVERYFAFGGGSIVYIVHEEDIPYTMGAVK